MQIFTKELEKGLVSASDTQNDVVPSFLLNHTVTRFAPSLPPLFFHEPPGTVLPTDPPTQRLLHALLGGLERVGSEVKNTIRSK